MTSSSADIVVSFHQVQLSLGGRLILQDFSLDIRRREFVCVIGPSGCGKTTLLRLLAGLLKPTSGQVVHEGRPVTGPSPDVAIVFQDYAKALLPWRTAAGNISLALESAGMPKGERSDRIAALLQKVGLSQHGNRYPAQLSGGMQQRLQIARCLAQEPAVLLMDEPFGALDAMTRQSLQDEVARIAADSGTTVLFITHDLDEALYLGDRVVALKADPGRLARLVDVPLARPRDQLATYEEPGFHGLRRSLFGLVQGNHS
ncbi:ABC transporter ATP-binding protein [Noviherbaspirillum sp. Root189]|uniref:ABC transporter ATP-binding protein n=1 Tax=Noviherbaspirillum sp. Root189 TaxID=1736487 RepID=UPI00070F2EC8|nr:ABC transporter ATP-binding protein [Noviherbaspirillum sp. Root189]KRB93547.1 ABC transporter [Noviherbaspirillum sp. Root189]